MKFSKVHIFIFLASFALTTLIVWFLLPSNKKSENIYFSQGYNFRQLHLNNSDIATLKINDKLDITNLKNSEGKFLLSFSSKKLFLLVAVDQFCPACKFSKDMMKDIRKNIQNTQTAYYPISIAPTHSSDTQKYAQNLGFEDYLYWSPELLPNSLSQIVTPSHILVDRNGIVVQVWYGSNENEDVRKRMSNQISSDLLLINDVFEVISNSH